MSKYKKGTAALGQLKETGGGAGTGNTPQYEFTPLKSGTKLKVKVKGTEDIMQYYGYGVFKKVNTFVAKNPSVRNERGFVVENPTPWDRVSAYYYEQAKKAEDSGDDAKAEELRRKGYQFAGKERYVIGFYDLTTGKDIAVDFTRDQARAVYEIIERFAKKLDDIPFELSKTGQRQDTKVSLMPILTEEELTEEEWENFKKAKGQKFNTAIFDSLLYEADEDEQIEFLKAAGVDYYELFGFDEKEENDEIDEDDPTKNF